MSSKKNDRFHFFANSYLLYKQISTSAHKTLQLSCNCSIFFVNPIVKQEYTSNTGVRFITNIQQLLDCYIIVYESQYHLSAPVLSITSKDVNIFIFRRFIFIIQSFVFTPVPLNSGDRILIKRSTLKNIKILIEPYWRIFRIEVKIFRIFIKRGFYPKGLLLKFLA